MKKLRKYLKWFIDWKHFRLIATLIFIVLVLIIAEWTGLRNEFNIDNLKKVFLQNIFIASLIYICLFSIGNILQIPGWIFLGSSVLILGPAAGYTLTLTAAIVSALFSFYIVKLIGGESLRKIEISWVKKLLATIDKHPIRTNIILRLVFQTAPPLNYSLALSGIRIKDYLLGAILGLPIPVLIYTIFIDTIMEKIV